MYAGSMFVSGRVAPPSGWQQMTLAAAERSTKYRVDTAWKQAQKTEALEAYDALAGDLHRVPAADPAQSADEITLIDALIFPAVGKSGTKSGGHSLPVVQIPLPSVTAWWMAEGEEIQGSESLGLSLGFIFPV